MIDTNFSFPDLSTAQGVLPEVEKRPLLTRMPNTAHDWVLQLDNTTITQLQTCPRAGMFYTIYRRQKPDRSPLIFGGAIHCGLEHIYKHGFNSESAAIAKILEYFSHHPYPTAGEWRTPAFAIESFQKYCSFWSLMDNFKPISSDWVEKPFALNIGSFELNRTLPYTYAQLTSESSNDELYCKTLHVQWSGKIDIVVDQDGSTFVVDHKTTSIGGDTFINDFQLAQQTHGYMWAVQKILGHPIAGFILNALIIRKPTVSGKGKGTEFERRHFYYTQESINEWYDDILHTIENFIHSITASSFPKATTWCFGKYGACQYHDICTLPKAQRPFMLFSDQYANVTWSPLDKDDSAS